MEAIRLRNEMRSDVYVALAVSLKRDLSGLSGAAGVAEVFQRADWSPPALYVFPRDRSVWVAPAEAVVRLSGPLRLLTECEAYFCDWSDGQTGERRLVYWAVG